MLEQMQLQDVATGRTLVLGMGNTLVSDDGVGIHAVRAFRERVNGTRPNVTIEETPVAGPALITLISGYEEVIVVDAVRTRDSKPGAVHVIELDALRDTRHTANPHSLNLYTAVELARSCGLPAPRRIRIIAVEILDDVNVCEQCTPPVRDAISHVVDILDKITGDQ